MQEAPIRAETTAEGWPVTIRRRNTGLVVYHGGWRVAVYKTEAGANRRVDRILDDSEVIVAQRVAHPDVQKKCADCGRNMRLPNSTDERSLAGAGAIRCISCGAHRHVSPKIPAGVFEGDE